MRSLGRFYLTSGFTTFPVPVQATPRQLLGPALNFPLMDATLAIRIIHAFANFSDAAISNSLTVTHAAIVVVAVGPVALLRVRVYDAKGPSPAPGNPLGVEGAWFGIESPELILGSDYRELTTILPNPTTGGLFQIRLETEVLTGSAAAQNLTVNLGCMFELFQRSLSES